MALSNEERKQLKSAGYVYNRSLGKWMKPDEIEKHNESMETIAQFETWIALIVVLFIFIWIFSYV
jgi:hypothetical protein